MATTLRPVAGFPADGHGGRHARPNDGRDARNPSGALGSASAGVPAYRPGVLYNDPVPMPSDVFDQQGGPGQRTASHSGIAFLNLATPASVTAVSCSHTSRGSSCPASQRTQGRKARGSCERGSGRAGEGKQGVATRLALYPNTQADVSDGVGHRVRYPPSGQLAPSGHRVHFSGLDNWRGSDTVSVTRQLRTIGAGCGHGVRGQRRRYIGIWRQACPATAPGRDGRLRSRPGRRLPGQMSCDDGGSPARAEGAARRIAPEPSDAWGTGVPPMKTPFPFPKLAACLLIRTRPSGRAVDIWRRAVRHGWPGGLSGGRPTRVRGRSDTCLAGGGDSGSGPVAALQRARGRRISLQWNSKAYSAWLIRY